MYIVIAGAGIIGFHMASLLAGEGQEVAIVEESEEVIESIQRQLDVRTILGGAATPRVLREAEVQRADLFIATTLNDETNMISCFMAKEMGAKITIARVRNPEYSGYFTIPAKSPHMPRKVVRPKNLGIDLFVNPELEAAREITSVLSSLYPSPSEEFADGRVQIREFKVEQESMLNKPLRELVFPCPCVVATIVRPEGTIVPSGNELIKQGDHIHILASKEAMDEVAVMFGLPQRPAKNVVILGGGLIGFRVAEELEKRQVLVKLIESNLNRCQEIATRLEHTVVVHGEGTDRDFLIEERIPSADAFVAASESDEINILCGLLAKNLGVSRSLVLVNKPEYISLAESVGIDTAISPLLLTSRKIARFALHGGVVSTALLGGKQVQAIEFVASPTAHIVERKVKEAGLPKEAIAGAITHNDTVIIPPNDSVVRPGDHLIIISPLSAIPAIEKLFK